MTHPIEAPFRAFAAAQGIDLRVATPSTGVLAMLRFYADVRADGCEDADRDMLLFQWGTYDWGDGRHFELDITRQLILPDEEDDEAIWQLHLTYRFTPTEDLAGVGAGDRWCRSPAELDGFTTFVRGTPAFVAVADRAPGAVIVRYECAG